jgi:hypothetical protein
MDGIIQRNGANAATHEPHCKRRPRVVESFALDRALVCIEAFGGDMAEAKQGHEELVKVFDTDEESEALVVRGLLQSAGIDAMIQNREAPQDILPGVGGVVVLVRPDQAEEATETIEAYRNQPVTDADENVSEEPA